jgi:PAS domain S-box-containing protein
MLELSFSKRLWYQRLLMNRTECDIVKRPYRFQKSQILVIVLFSIISFFSTLLLLFHFKQDDSEHPAIQPLIAYIGTASVNFALFFAALMSPLIDRAAAKRASSARLEDEKSSMLLRNVREAALIDVQKQFRSVLITVPSAMFIVDGIGTIHAFSASAERMFGYAAHEVIGLNIAVLATGPTHHQAESFLERYHAGGKSHVSDATRVLYARRRDNSLLPVDLWMDEIDDGLQPLYTGFLRDLTEKSAAEEPLGEMRGQLLHISRLSAMGEMAAELAHELNQPLAAAAYFIGAADLVLAEDANREQGRALLRLGGEQVLRGAEIIRRMRGFASTDVLDMQSVSISSIIKDAMAMAVLGEGLDDIQLLCDFDSEADLGVG